MVTWIDCWCFQSYGFLGGAGRLELSVSNTGCRVENTMNQGKSKNMHLSSNGGLAMNPEGFP